MSGKQAQCHPSLARPPHLERAEPRSVPPSQTYSVQSPGPDSFAAGMKIEKAFTNVCQFHVL